MISVTVDPVNMLLYPGWSGACDANAQPIDRNGRVLCRRYVRIGEGSSYSRNGLLVYPPRLMSNIARTAYWSVFARRRLERYWDQEIMPLARAVHAAGGLAFARAHDEGDGFDVWRTSTGSRAPNPDRLVFSRDRYEMPKRDEPLEEEALLQQRELLLSNRKLGETLNRAYERACFGDIRTRCSVVTHALHWAMHEIIRRRTGEVTPETGPRIVRFDVENVGEWIWQRANDGWTWQLASSPLLETIRIPIEDRRGR